MYHEVICPRRLTASLRGGLLTGRVLSVEDFDSADKTGSRFDGRWQHAAWMREKWGPVIPVLATLDEGLVNIADNCVCISLADYCSQKKHAISMPEASLRWIQHHSALTPTDVVILGCTSMKQLETNIDWRYVGILLAKYQGD